MGQWAAQAHERASTQAGTINQQVRVTQKEEREEDQGHMERQGRGGDESPGSLGEMKATWEVGTSEMRGTFQGGCEQNGCHGGGGDQVFN